MADDAVTRTPKNRDEIVAEQDKAAGGRDSRRVSFPDGSTATASISLTRRLDGTYGASLRFKHGGRTFRRNVGGLAASTRAEALRDAWRIAIERNFLVE